MRSFTLFNILVATVSAFTPNTAFFNSRNSALFAKVEGTVKWFDVQKGFGFIIPSDGSRDVFVHQTNIQVEGFRSLADGETVEYETVTDENGRISAIEVTGPGGGDVQGAPFQPQSSWEE